MTKQNIHHYTDRARDETIHNKTFSIKLSISVLLGTFILVEAMKGSRHVGILISFTVYFSFVGTKLMIRFNVMICYHNAHMTCIPYSIAFLTLKSSSSTPLTIGNF